MPRPVRALFVQDQPDELARLVAGLERDGWRVDPSRVSRESELRHALQDPAWQVVIAADDVAGLPLPRILELTLANATKRPCIVVSDHVGTDANGAAESPICLVPKGEPGRLSTTLARALPGPNGSTDGTANVRALDLDLQVLLDGVTEGVLVTDLNDRVLFANRAMEALCGFAGRELAGRPAFEFLLPERDWYPLFHRNEARAQGASERYEADLNHKDGGTRRVRIHASPLVDRTGRIVGTIGAHADLTERHRLEGRLQLLEQAVEDTREAVLVLSVIDAEALTLRIEYANPAFGQMSGFGPDEVIGRDPRFLVGPETDRATMARLGEAMRARQAARVELLHYRRDGSTFWADVNVAPVAGGGDGTEHWVSVLHDVTDRVLHRQEVERLNTRLAHSAEAYRRLATFSADIERVPDVEGLIDMGLTRLTAHLGMEVAAFYDVSETVTMTRRIGPLPRGIEEPARREQRHFGGVVGHVARTGEATFDLEYARSARAIPEAAAAGLRSQLTLPVFDGPRVRHVLAIASLQRTVPLDDEDVSVAQAFVRRLENALERARHLEEVTATREATFRSLGIALEYRDYETRGHADRVATLARQFGEALGFERERLRALQWGAYLHDLGKIAIPDAILLKPGQLTDEEFETIKAHAVYSDAMTRDIAFLPDASRALVRHHHERWDGAGYPDGLAGAEIPLEARIFSLVDVWDALTHDRPYKEAWTREAALAEIREQAGRQFDPDLVRVFEQVVAAAGREDVDDGSR